MVALIKHILCKITNNKPYKILNKMFDDDITYFGKTINNMLSIDNNYIKLHRENDIEEDKILITIELESYQFQVNTLLNAFTNPDIPIEYPYHDDDNKIITLIS